MHDTKTNTNNNLHLQTVSSKKAHECNLHSDPCQGQHTKMNKFPPIKASTHNNDYTLLECIDIPEKVGVEEVRHIGKVLEQALPPLARKALVWSNSSVKLQFALYMSRRFFDCQVISLQKIQNL